MDPWTILGWILVALIGGPPLAVGVVFVLVGAVYVVAWVAGVLSAAYRGVINFFTPAAVKRERAAKAKAKRFGYRYRPVSERVK